jgi:hypothetical protein
VVRRLFQNLCRFLESLLRLVYSDIDKRKLVTIVQVFGCEFLRFHQERSRPQGCPFGRPHCTATSIGHSIPGIEPQGLEILDLGGVILPRFKVAFPLLQSTGLLHLRGATTAKQHQHGDYG